MSNSTFKHCRPKSEQYQRSGDEYVKDPKASVSIPVILSTPNQRYNQNEVNILGLLISDCEKLIKKTKFYS